MENSQFEKTLEKFENRLDQRISERLSHHDQIFSQKISNVELRIESQNLALVKIGEIIQRSGQSNSEAISKSQQAMVEQTKILMDGNKESLTRVHLRLDEIKTELSNGSERFGKLETRIAHLERIVFTGFSIVGASAVGAIFKFFGGN
jgi:hypothetical protein